MYAKIFTQMYDGTLGSKGPWEALVTFQQLLILSDNQGHVDMTPEAISKRTTVPLKIILKGLRELEKPDPGSRTPDEDGRRIMLLADHRDWGWRIVNYGIYNVLRSEVDRRDYMKGYMRQKRDLLAPVNSGKLPLGQLAPVDVDVDVDVYDKNKYSTAIVEVFKYYKTIIGKSDYYPLTETRLRQGIARLRTALKMTDKGIPGATKMMMRCVDQLKSSDFHNGHNDGGKKYNDWGNLFRSDDMFTKWLEKAASK